MIKPCLITMLLLSVSGVALSYIDVDRLADAVYKAEGGAKTKHHYGVLTHYKHTTPRQACINSIKSAIKRANSDDPAKVIPEMGRVYCPPSAHPLNRNWVKNVSYWYENRAF